MLTFGLVCLGERTTETLQLTCGTSIDDFIAYADHSTTEEAGINLGMYCNLATVNRFELLLQKGLLLLTQLGCAADSSDLTPGESSNLIAQRIELFHRALLQTTNRLQCQCLGSGSDLAVKNLG